MEELKPLDKLTEPDERIRYFVGYSLKYFHGRAARITINATAPENVHNQFTIARSALVYSYFFYPFFPVALLYSFLAVEAALSARVKATKPELFSGAREPTLYPLLEVALKSRWITDAGFTRDGPSEPGVPDRIAAKYPNIPNDQRYSYSLLDSLVSLRNSLAHGEYMLMPNMAPLLDRGAQIINQLFPQPVAAP
jgi:hypothetical protein